MADLGQNDAVRELAREGRRRLADFLRARQHQTRPLHPDLPALVVGPMEAVIHDVILEHPDALEDPRLIDELTAGA